MKLSKDVAFHSNVFQRFSDYYKSEWIRSNDLYTVVDTGSCFSILFTDYFPAGQLSRLEIENAKTDVCYFAGTGRYHKCTFYKLLTNNYKRRWNWNIHIFGKCLLSRNSFYNSNYYVLISKEEYVMWTGLESVDDKCVGIIGTNLIERCLLNTITRSVQFYKLKIKKTAVLPGLNDVNTNLFQIHSLRDDVLTKDENSSFILTHSQNVMSGNISHFGSYIGIVGELNTIDFISRRLSPIKLSMMIDTGNLGNTIVHKNKYFRELEKIYPLSAELILNLKIETINIIEMTHSTYHPNDLDVKLAAHEILPLKTNVENESNRMYTLPRISNGSSLTTFATSDAAIAEEEREDFELRFHKFGFELSDSSMVKVIKKDIERNYFYSKERIIFPKNEMCTTAQLHLKDIEFKEIGTVHVHEDDADEIEQHWPSAIIGTKTLINCGKLIFLDFVTGSVFIQPHDGLENLFQSVIC